MAARNVSFHSLVIQTLSPISLEPPFPPPRPWWMYIYIYNVYLCFVLLRFFIGFNHALPLLSTLLRILSSLASTTIASYGSDHHAASHLDFDNDDDWADDFAGMLGV